VDVVEDGVFQLLRRRSDLAPAPELVEGGDPEFG
jgi:hypothetical protein